MMDSKVGDERRKQLLERASQMVWFHAIDFGGVRSSGRFPEDQPQNCTLYGAMDLMNHVAFSGLNCGDIGAADGLLSFHMKSAGASCVTATNATPTSPGLTLASELLDIPVELMPSTTFANVLGKLPRHSFDVLAAAGVLYHMLNPFDCILKARQLVKRDGLLILETAFDAKDQTAAIHFNDGDFKEVYTYWIPTRPAVLAMLRLAGFEVLAVRVISAPSRLTVIAKNVDPEEVSGRSDFMVRQHKAGIADPEFQISLPAERSPASYSGPRDDILLDWKIYQPRFFPHASLELPALGSSAWNNLPR